MCFISRACIKYIDGNISNIEKYIMGAMYGIIMSIAIIGVIEDETN